MLLYVLMVMTALGMLYANRQYTIRGVVWGRPLAGILGILTVGLAVAKIWMMISYPSQSHRQIIKREKRFLDSTAQLLGDYIAINYPMSKILLITDPITKQRKKSYETTKEFLEKGLGSKAVIMASDSPVPANIDTLNEDENFLGEEEAFTAVSFDLMTERHPHCNLVISLIGLPTDYEEMKFWSTKSEKRPKLVVVGDPYELKNAVEAGYISAIVALNPRHNHDLEKELPKSYREVFHQRFLLINRENINVLADDNPGLFMSEGR